MMMMVSSLLNMRPRRMQLMLMRRLQLVLMMRLQMAIMGRWMLLLNPDRSD